MNSFLLHTSNFLNNFSAVSEERLAQQLLEMQKLEVAISILEAKVFFSVRFATCYCCMLDLFIGYTVVSAIFGHIG